MKSLFEAFSDSSKSLKDTRTLATTGIMLAMALVLRGLSVQVTEDVRIVFSFVPICIIGMLYGPAVCAMANVSLDIIGFIIDTKSARGYSPQLSLLSVAVGLMYGFILYKRSSLKPCKSDILRIFIARLAVVVICNVLVRSYLMYTMYVNPDFALFSADGRQWQAFAVYLQPRIIKSAVEFPIDIVILTVTLPVALQAYNRTVNRLSSRKNS